MADRNYSDKAVLTALTSAITSTTATSILVAAVTDFPVVYPYTLTIESGTSSQEHVDVTGPPTGTGPYTLTVVRGVGGSTKTTHAVNASVEHRVISRDLRELVAAKRPATENYLLGWTFPSEDASGSTQPTVGEVYLQRVRVAAPGTINTIYSFATTAGVSMTTAQNFVGLYDLSGTRVATSADCSTLWQAPNVGAGGSHVVQIPLVSGLAVGGGDELYVAALFNGPTMPNVASKGQGYFDLPSMGAGVASWASVSGPYNVLAPNRWKFMSWSSGVTALPASLDLNYANPDKAFLFGIA